MIKWKQDKMGFDEFGLDFGNPDFVKYAESYGAKGTRVKSAMELEGVLKNALEDGGVHLVEIPVDYSENKILANQSCL